MAEKKDAPKGKPEDKGAAKPAAAPGAAKPAAAGGKPGAPAADKGAAPKPAAAKAPAPAPAPQPAAAPKAPKPKSGPKLPPKEKVLPMGPMRKLKVAKVTVNIGVGQSGDRLEKAEKVLAGLTNAKPVRTLSRHAVRDWNLREGQPIGVKVTLRGDNAVDFVKRALWTRNNRVAEWSFDKEGNLQFGIPDHTSFEGQKYNPEIGIFGMDIAVTIERPGFRIKHRGLLQRRIPPRHRVTRTESKEYLKEILGVEIV